MTLIRVKNSPESDSFVLSVATIFIFYVSNKGGKQENE